MSNLRDILATPPDDWANQRKGAQLESVFDEIHAKGIEAFTTRISILAH